MLLDVDGVINDLGHLEGQPRPWDTRIIAADGFRIHIPDFMPMLIQSLAAVCEIHWCTTWRERANGALAEALGAGPFPVIDDGTDDRYPDWKPRAAYDLVAEAVARGREVYWIEDFYGEYPVDVMPPGIVYVDTAVIPGGAVLTFELLPPELKGRIR